MPKDEKTSTRVDFRMSVDLHQWVKDYAAKNKTTVTRIIIDHFLELKKREEHVEQF